jgi:ADP-dependent glucokinase
MANRMFTEGIRNVLLGSVRTVDLERLLPKGIKITGSGDIVNDKQANEVSKDDITDDIHVLLEFPAGQSWMGLTSPRANRFIVHSDDSNPRIAALESFHEAVDKFYPDLLVVSGLQMLDNFPSPDKASRIDKLSSFLQDFHMNHPDSKVHFEMASFTEPALVSQVIKDILPNADSVGMNEQEIANLDSIFSVGNISLVSNPYPRTAVVLDQMRNIFSHLDTLSGGRISRIHVHTLAFQAILVKKGSSWKETRAAAVKSALTAHRHTCGDHDIDVDKARLIMDDSFSTTDRDHRLRIQFEPQFPVPCWQESLGSTGNIGVSICVAPVLVCTEVLQTGGGGDNVSAAGLMAQI